VVAAWLQPLTAPVLWTLLGLLAVIMQLSLVLLLVVTLTYSLLAQTGWSITCALFWQLLPASMMQAAAHATPDRRCADWWTPTNLEAAYAAHKVLHGQGSMRRSRSCLGGTSVSSHSTRHSLSTAMSVMSADTQPLVSSSSQVAGGHSGSGLSSARHYSSSSSSSIIPPVAQDRVDGRSSKQTPPAAVAYTSGLYNTIPGSSSEASGAAQARCNRSTRGSTRGSPNVSTGGSVAPRSAPSLGGMP
jgi:hypothetical protein